MTALLLTALAAILAMIWHVASQPKCSKCGTVMRRVDGWDTHWVCNVCGNYERH